MINVRPASRDTKNYIHECNVLGHYQCDGEQALNIYGSNENKIFTRVFNHLSLFQIHSFVNVYTPKGGRAFLVISVWNLRTASFIPLFYIYLLSCSSAYSPVAISVLSFSVFGPDLFLPKPPFSERLALLCGSCLFVCLSS